MKSLSFSGFSLPTSCPSPLSTHKHPEIIFTRNLIYFYKDNECLWTNMSLFYFHLHMRLRTTWTEKWIILSYQKM